jgi:hypothetical protein
VASIQGRDVALPAWRTPNPVFCIRLGLMEEDGAHPQPLPQAWDELTLGS